MKYKFTKIDEDTTELSYKDKKFTIKKDIDLLRTMESLNVRAKRKMYSDLAKDGMTADDLTITRKEGNKTIVDKSSLINLEKEYVDLVSNEMMSDITRKYTNMGLVELLQDIEINTSDLGAGEQAQFIMDFLSALKGEKSPSVPKIEEVK